MSVSAGAFRFAMGRGLGWDTVRSNWFDLADGLTIRGKGEGHGVGLCQRGADHMGSEGHGYREILAYYYPGASTTKWIRLEGEGVAVFATDPPRDREVLTEAEQILKHLPWPVNGEISLYVHPSLDAFRNATAEPGWVVAHTEGNRVDIQPVPVLLSRGILRGTLRHELLHVAVESRANPGLPVWFREGVVDWLAGAHGRGMKGAPSDSDLRQRGDRGRAEQGYREARARVADLVAHYGEGTVIGWISRGLPDEVKNSSASSANTKSR